MHSALQIRQGSADLALGQEMYITRRNGDEMPTAVEIDDSDSQQLKVVKELILKMTSYGREHRPISSQVLVRLAPVIPAITNWVSRNSCYFTIDQAPYVVNLRPDIVAGFHS